MWTTFLQSSKNLATLPVIIEPLFTESNKNSIGKQHKNWAYSENDKPSVYISEKEKEQWLRFMGEVRFKTVVELVVLRLFFVPNIKEETKNETTKINTHLWRRAEYQRSTRKRKKGILYHAFRTDIWTPPRKRTRTNEKMIIENCKVTFDGSFYVAKAPQPSPYGNGKKKPRKFLKAISIPDEPTDTQATTTCENKNEDMGTRKRYGKIAFPRACLYPRRTNDRRTDKKAWLQH